MDSFAQHEPGVGNAQVLVELDAACGLDAMVWPNRAHKKRPGRSSPPGLFSILGDGSSLRCSLGNGLLDRLIGIASHADVHLTEVRCFGDPGVIGLLGVLRLDLDGLPCKRPPVTVAPVKEA